MPEQLFITQLLNRTFGPSLLGVLHALNIHPKFPQAPFTDAFALELMVVLLLIAFFLAVRASLSVETPGTVQQTAEMLHEFVGEQASQIIGHGYQRFEGFVTTILLFVVCCNLLGLIPGIDTPTGNPAVPLGLAIVTFLYYNFYGLKEQGVVGYIKHFMGPVWWISPLLFPIEIISHLARIMSLTIRLYANMFASDLLTLVFFSLIPFGMPAIFLALHFGVSLIQGYVFMLLALIYLSQAVAHEH